MSNYEDIREVSLDREDIDDLAVQIGEFRNRNQNCFVTLDGVSYTWSDLGSDRRIAEWRAGHYLYKGYDSSEIPEVVMEEFEDGAEYISDFLKNNYELPDGCDERTWFYIADKCAKTISFGGTWTQIVKYIEKEMDYLNSTVRGVDGRRVRKEMLE